MRLSDLVTIDNRFEKSINLLFDLNNPQKLQLYIPTRSSIRILTEYLREAFVYSGNRANILIGPYGKGKSHLLLVLLAILSGNHSKETTDLIERISAYDEAAGKAINNIYRQKKFLPVIINANSGNLSQAFLRSLNQALKRDGLDEVVPDNYFTEAIKTIANWKEFYPDTYAKFEEKITDTTVETFVRNLEQFDYDALNYFRELHPLLTSGSEFNPRIENEVLSVYQSLNRIICNDYSYSGIYIIFDEFSKYIEGHSEEGFSADMKILQDICELCNTSKDEQLHITFVAHKAIRAYGEQLSKSIKNAFRGVEGRLKEIQFIVSSQNNYELIADAVKKKNTFYTWKENDTYRTMVDRSFHISEFKALFEKKDFLEIVGEGAFPLTPLSALLLLGISEKIAQNERTIFTFLTGNDMYSLSTFVKNNKAACYAGANLIYDYFSQLMENEKDLSVHNEWLKAEYALSKITDTAEKVIVKTLAVIKIINRPDDIPGIREYLFLASGLEQEIFDTACQKLLEAGILQIKRGTQAFDFLNSVGINVYDEVSDYAIKYFSKTDLSTSLNTVIKQPYILPKKYNQEYCMTRNFKIQFMEKDALLAMKSTSYFQNPFKTDGYLVIALVDDKNDIEDIQSHVIEIDDSILVVGCIQNDKKCEEIAKLHLAAKYLLEDKDFISDNEVVVTELKLLCSDLIDELNQWAELSIANIKTLYTREGGLNIGVKGLNRAISDICEKVYSETPIINHELINRNYVSAPISKVRNNIIDDVFNSRSLDKYMSGTSAESTIYRAVMVHPNNDPMLARVKDIILEYIHTCKGKKVQFSQLYDVLTKSPIGMRRGVIPIYIAEQIMKLEDMPVVYQGKKEISIDPQLLSNINSAPEEYALFVEEETVEKLEYIEGLEKLYKEYEAYCRELGNRNRLSRLICTMQSWYRSLPQTSIIFKKPDNEDQDIHKIISFRKIFTESPNPREVVFEKIPRIFGNNDFRVLLNDVTKIKTEIDAHIHKLKKSVEKVIRNELLLSEEQDFFMSIKTWYGDIPEHVKNSILSSDSQRLLNAIKNLSVTDNEEIVEQLSKASTNFYVEDWRDDTIIEFSQYLKQMMTEINNKRSQKALGGGRITFSDGESTRDLFYDYNPDQVSSTGTFFENALEELLEDYGTTLENSEKIGILMNTIKKLLG